MGLLHCEGLSEKRTTIIFLILLLLLATLLRFYALDAKSLWQDEITTLKHVTSGEYWMFYISNSKGFCGASKAPCARLCLD